MKNKFLKVFLSILLLLSAKNVEALDITKTGHIDVTYQYDEKVFDNAKITLYKVATMDENGTLAYEDVFQGNKELNNLTTSEWSELAESLSEFAEKNKVSHYKLETTSKEGKVSFDALPVGLYLIQVENLEQNGYQYNSLPMLISLPNFDEVINDYIYDMNIITKTEEKKIEDKEEPPKKDDKPINNNTGNNIRVPYTFDSIMIYAIIAIASLVAIIVLIYFINRNKKGKEANENQEK